MSISGNPISSNLLKKISNFIESSTYQKNSFIFNPKLLKRYGPSSRQTFIKVPKSKTAYLREDILVPEEKEIICDKFLALELINDLKTLVTLLEYCNSILNLLIFSIFSDRQSFIKVPKSKTAYSREDIFGHAERQAPHSLLWNQYMLLRRICETTPIESLFQESQVTYNDGLQLM